MIDLPLRDRDGSDARPSARAPLAAAWAMSVLCLALGVTMIVGGASITPPFANGVSWNMTEGLRFEWPHVLEWAVQALQLLGPGVVSAGVLGTVATAAVQVWMRGADDRAA